MEKPLVSIILPTYRTAPFLQKAIESVCAQRYQKWELLIVDDGLDESVRKKVDACAQSDVRIVCISSGAHGLQRALNTGLMHANGEYIARIDDDDEWSDALKLEQQIHFLETNPEYVLLGTNARITNEYGAALGVYTMPSTDEAIRSRILSKNCFLHPTVVMRTSAVRKVGGYSEELCTKHIEDYALWLSLGRIGKFANLDTSAARLTVHAASMTFQNRVVQAKRMFRLARTYRQVYPGFLKGQLLLGIRIVGFTFLKILPLPQQTLYRIQKIYKEF